MGADGAAAGAEQARPYLLRVERLFRGLVRRSGPDGPDGLWRFQHDLMAVQRDVQQAIGEAKRAGPAGRDALAALRSARWHARCLGDAFAWLVLGMERQHIFPLAANAPVAVGPDDQGSKGVVAIAEALWAEGWGFPLLHDATDVLRIGDITFVRPGRPPLTVEVKTRLDSDAPVVGDGTSSRYTVTVIAAQELPGVRSGPSPERGPPDPSAAPATSGTDGEAGPAAGEPRPRRPQPRVERQARRLQAARARQTAEPDAVFNADDGRPVLNRHVRSSHPGHDDLLRRVVRRARATGYAAEAVEGTFLYAAVFDPAGLGAGRLPDVAAGLPGDVVASGIFDERDAERNALVVNQVPQQGGRGPRLFLPYFLLGLPRVAICDVLHGRMVLLNLVNPGRVMQALEHAGFKVDPPAGRNALQDDNLRLRAEGIDGDGIAYRAELGNLTAHVTEMLHEFRSVSHLTDIARSMLDAIIVDRIRTHGPAGDEAARDQPAAGGLL